MQEDLRNKETSSAELQQGLKKMQLAVKLGIHLTDLVEDLMPVPADAIPRIVGKVRRPLDCRVFFRLPTQSPRPVCVPRCRIGADCTTSRSSLEW